MKEIVVVGRRIEAAWHGPTPDQAPTLVLLHEGLGCVEMWRDFPARLAERTGYGVLVYSRAGYGKSDPVPLPRPLTYMHEEALDVLPQVLDQAGIRKTVLVGHSDGASIATIYAGGRLDFRVRIALLAPHFSSRKSASSASSRPRSREKEIASGWRAITAASARPSGAGTRLNDPKFRDWRIDDICDRAGADPAHPGRGRRVRKARARSGQFETYCPVETLSSELPAHPAIRPAGSDIGGGCRIRAPDPDGP
jgi:pimeloyl-ACP methyl ester carboxylesterase